MVFAEAGSRVCMWGSCWIMLPFSAVYSLCVPVAHWSIIQYEQECAHGCQVDQSFQSLPAGISTRTSPKERKYNQSQNKTKEKWRPRCWCIVGMSLCHLGHSALNWCSTSLLLALFPPLFLGLQSTHTPPAHPLPCLYVSLYLPLYVCHPVTHLPPCSCISHSLALYFLFFCHRTKEKTIADFDHSLLLSS